MSLSSPYDLVVSIVLYKPNIPHLRETIDSLSSTALKLKIVLHDNSPDRSDLGFSTPHTLEYFYNDANEGFGAGHNKNIVKFIDEAPYFLVLNPDTFFEPDLLPELIKRMEKDHSIGLCIPKICHPSGELQNVNRRLPRPQDYIMNFVNGKLGRMLLASKTYEQFLLRDLDYSRPFICPMISGCFMLFRSEILKSVGGFDKRYFLYLEDADLSRRTAMVSKTVVFCDLVAHHHWTRGAYRNIRLFLQFIRNMIKYFNKWGWFWDRERDELNRKVTYYDSKFSTEVRSPKNIYE